jgi:PTS system mannose-specific IID component
LAGNWAGAAIMFLLGVVWSVLMIPLFYMGYRQGTGLVDEVTGGGLIDRVTNIATIFGVMVVGGFVPSIMSKLTSPLTFHKTVEIAGKATTQTLSLQTILNQILPAIFPILTVGLAYWLVKRWKISPVWILLILVVVAFGTSAIGLL